MQQPVKQAKRIQQRERELELTFRDDVISSERFKAAGTQLTVGSHNYSLKSPSPTENNKMFLIFFCLLWISQQIETAPWKALTHQISPFSTPQSVEGLVDLIQRETLGDELVQLQPSVHVIVNQLGHVPHALPTFRVNHGEKKKKAALTSKRKLFSRVLLNGLLFHTCKFRIGSVSLHEPKKSARWLHTYPQSRSPSAFDPSAASPPWRSWLQFPSSRQWRRRPRRLWWTPAQTSATWSRRRVSFFLSAHSTGFLRQPTMTTGLPTHSTAKSTPLPVIFTTTSWMGSWWSLGLMQSVAPNSRAFWNLAGLTSTAMILLAPAASQPMMAASPTAPRPNTAHTEFASTWRTGHGSEVRQPSRVIGRSERSLWLLFVDFNFFWFLTLPEL